MPTLAPSAPKLRRLARWAACVLSLCFAVGAAAQNFSLRHHMQSDGLANLAITALVQMPDGQLWIGTENGLYRHDGVRITRVDAEEAPMPSRHVSALALDGRGGLWVGTASGVSAAHAYAQGGSYLVTLTVTDNAGATGSTQRAVVVQAPAPAITLTLSTNGKRSQVNLVWSGATGTKVDVRRNGALLINTRNAGSYVDRDVAKGNRYTYRVCQTGSTTACSPDATIDL